MRRLHPLTPLLRSWILIAAGIGWLWAQFSNTFTSRIFGTLPGEEGESSTQVEVLIALFGVVLVAALVYGYLYWRFARFGIVEDVLRIETGVLFRRTRQVRLDRLQAVDIVRPIAARLVGAAELRFEVGGGGTDQATLAYLSLQEAHAVRAALLARAAGLDAATPEAPERTITRVPLSNLVLASLLAPTTVFFVLLAAAFAMVVVWTDEVSLVVPMIPAVFGAGLAATRRFVVNYGFTVAESPDGLRIRKGLLDTRAQTVPPGRVQAIKITAPLLWRHWGFVRVDVNVAGYATSRDRDMEATSVVLPVGSREVADDLLRRVVPGLDTTKIAQHAVPARARWLRPFGAPYLSAGHDSEFFVAHEGWLTRVVLVMPQAKPQSIRLTQGPLQRRLRLATVHLDSTRGPARVTAFHRDALDGRRLLEAEVAAERAARARARPDRWMAAATPTDTKPGSAGHVVDPASSSLSAPTAATTG